MKSILKICLLLVSLNAVSQDGPLVAAAETPPVETSALEVRPEYPGGMEAFYQHIAKNFQIPDLTAGGKIYVEFIIEKDGSTAGHRIIREPEPGLGNEAIRVIKLAKKWSPGILNGHPVRVRYTLPIAIHASE